jgi:hypothetical protein
MSYGLRQLLLHGAAAASDVRWSEKARERNRGGFLPYDDQPESAHATVDATWDALLALSSVYEQYDRIESSDASLTISRGEVLAA